MLSIIIPTLNEEKTLEKTLLSLAKLTHFPYEVIISDGKSTDKTLEIAKKYNCKIALYKDSKRQTIGQGRNLGAELASGEYFIFLDADVVIPNIDDFFDKAIENFKKNKILTGLAPFLDYDPETATRADKFFGGMMNLVYFVSNNILHIGQAAGEFQMMKSEHFKKLGGYNEKLIAAEDVEMFSRLNSIGQTRIDKKLHVHQSTRRVHATGWPKLLWSWFRNAMSSKFFKKAFDSEWKPIR